MSGQNPTRRARPGESIYEEVCEHLEPAEDGTVAFDCDGCGYLFQGARAGSFRPSVSKSRTAVGLDTLPEVRLQNRRDLRGRFDSVSPVRG